VFRQAELRLAEVVRRTTDGQQEESSFSSSEKADHDDCQDDKLELYLAKANQRAIDAQLAADKCKAQALSAQMEYASLATKRKGYGPQFGATPSSNESGDIDHEMDTNMLEAAAIVDNTAATRRRLSEA
jgi:hypothetical protein